MDVEAPVDRAALLSTDDYYLSERNPAVTVDQQELELLALQVMAHPLVVRARQEVARRWKTIAGRDTPAEALSRFDELVEEFAFNDVLKAVNSDSNYPRVLGMLWAPPRAWLGRRIPGSRGSGGDCPDNHYAIIPLDGRARFEVKGRRFDPAPADVPFAVSGNNAITMTVATLEWQDVVFDDDGGFTLTIGPEAAAGRPNHIQVPVDAMFLFVRSCRSDWQQVPVGLRVRRLDPPTAPPLSATQMAERAAKNMVENVAAMYWYMRVFAAMDANVISPAFATGSISGLVTQLISFIRLDLAEDEAYVVTVGDGEASFRDLVVHDYWFRTIDYPVRQSSLTVAQSVPNGDGTTTYVLSRQDPGIHNWLDTCGLRQTLVVHRWQGMPRVAERPMPSTRGQLVKLADLDAVLPTGIRNVSPAERKRQIGERHRSYRLRLIDR